MLGVNLGLRPDRALRVLCVGAHSDDIEIGCGATMLKLARSYPSLQVRWVVLSADETRAAEARAGAEAFLRRVTQCQILVQGFRDGYFPYQGAEIKAWFTQLAAFDPDLIFTHSRNDLHQDHRLVNELTWNTFRDHMILEYEIPKYDGDLGTRNFYVQLDHELCWQKVDHLLNCFVTQRDKPWFSAETFLGLMRLRGIEARSPSGYAEAFYCRKIVLSGLGPAGAGEAV